ncbi:MAG: S-methyl-5-thioribose-1-phosphate isomerase [Candidatus Diapherotrites archaeon]
MNVEIAGRKKWFTAVWLEGSTVKMIDQSVLPHKFKIASFKNHHETAKAIKEMIVRGAGSIGVAAAFGATQAVMEGKTKKGFEELRKTRPTARDLFWAIERIENSIKEKKQKEAKLAAIREANKISTEYIENGKRIGKNGLVLFKHGTRVLTHCNAGWLAMQDWGSALAPIYWAKKKGKNAFVFVDETRPRLQGAKLTAWELSNEGIKHKIIADNAAGHYMQKGAIDFCIVGADRIARNGDIANKIGTYEKAVLAKENRIPFYVAAPKSTIDLKCKKGAGIKIEERSEKEVLFLEGKRIANTKSSALNPAFDITPSKYITGIITEKGIIKPNRKEIKRLFNE